MGEELPVCWSRYSALLSCPFHCSRIEEVSCFLDPANTQVVCVCVCVQIIQNPGQGWILSYRGFCWKWFFFFQLMSGSMARGWYPRPPPGWCQALLDAIVRNLKRLCCTLSPLLLFSSPAVLGVRVHGSTSSTIIVLGVALPSWYY